MFNIRVCLALSFVHDRLPTKFQTLLIRPRFLDFVCSVLIAVLVDHYRWLFPQAKRVMLDWTTTLSYRLQPSQIPQLQPVLALLALIGPAYAHLMAITHQFSRNIDIQGWASEEPVDLILFKY